MNLRRGGHVKRTEKELAEEAMILKKQDLLMSNCPEGCNESKLHGACIDGECKCAPQYTGDACQRLACMVPEGCDSECCGEGACGDDGKCACNEGFSGLACEIFDPQCLNQCSGRDHGVCIFDPDDPSGIATVCACKAPWSGEDCSQSLCPNDCNGHGECQTGGSGGKGSSFCSCRGGGAGKDCHRVACPGSRVAPFLECSGRGRCFNGDCVCPDGFPGEACDGAGTHAGLERSEIFAALFPTH
jgi:syndecan 4